MTTRRWSWLAMTAIVLLPGFAVRGDDEPKAAKVKEEELRQELLRRTKEDQDARNALIDAMAGRGSKDAKASPTAEATLAHKVEAIDAANTARMKEIVERHGWPGKSLVGADGASAAWLLVQHADQDRAFQKRCLELMKPAVKLGDASGKELAYLTDRVALAEGKKQIYGTQFHQVGDKWEPKPIDDEANVDKRRAEVGLMPMAEYRKQIEAMYRKSK
jgi:hypothetical protein